MYGFHTVVTIVQVRSSARTESYNIHFIDSSAHSVASLTAERKCETAKPGARKHFMVMFKKDQDCCEFAQWATNFQLGSNLPKRPYVTG